MTTDIHKIPQKDSSFGKRTIKSLEATLGHRVYESGVWSDEKRVEAVTAYITLGKMPKVSALTSIPVDTLWAWKKYSNWWTDLEKTIRGEQNNEYSATITNIVTSTLAAIEDRVSKGDFHYNPRSGETVRVPVSAKNLNNVVNTLLDKRNKLVRENQSESAPADEKTLENKLTQLADAFKAFVGSRNVPTIDVEVVEQQQ